MSFKAERYPKNWRLIVRSIRARADEACECVGECGDTHEGGRCNAPNHHRICRETKSPAHLRLADEVGRLYPFEPFGEPVSVVLTVAHVDHNEANNDPENLRALCQRCHLKLDAEDNARRRRANARRGKAAGMLPGLGGERG